MGTMVKVERLHRFIAIIWAVLKRKTLALGTVLAFILFSGPIQAEFGSIVDIGLAGDLYFSDATANNGQGFVNLLIQNTWSESQLWIDVGAGGLVGDTAASYVKAPQLFYRIGSTDKAHFIFGRARHMWSFQDDFWNLGLTQPLFTWNEATPEKQGLSGVFFKYPVLEKTLNFTLFASYLFLPSQGPSYELTNGNLTSSNPWFNDPVEVINLAGEKAQLNFDIDVPKTQDVVFRHSFGGQFSTPMNKKGLLFNAYYLNKPRNEVILPFEGVLNLTTFNGDVTVFPQVARHSVAGIDVGWHLNRFKSLLSWGYESSLDYVAPSNTTYPIVPEQNIFSFQQLYRINKSQRVWFGYINIDRKQNQLSGVFANSQIRSLLNRNRFEEAVSLRWEGLLFKSLNKYRVRAALAYNHSLYKDNMWLSADLKWSAYKGLEMFSRCDIFGGTDKDISTVDFISGYQNNDRCLLGGHYAF